MPGPTYHRDVAPPLRRRRPGWRARETAFSRIRIIIALGLPVIALGAAPMAFAAPASAPVSGLTKNLPSVLPSVCVGGVVLCPGSGATLPTPLPVPLPTVCVTGVGCSSDIVTVPTARPAVTPPPSTNRPTAAPPNTVSAGGGQRSGGPGTAQTIVDAPLPAPPGVIPVPLPRATRDGALNPDAFAEVLSLSMRDGLGSAGYHVWPWLLGFQLALWTAIALVAWWRKPAGGSVPAKG